MLETCISTCSLARVCARHRINNPSPRMRNSYLFKVNLGELPREASIISFINIQDGALPLETGDMALAEVVELFPTILEAIINEIYDVEVPFAHDDSKQFSYCAYC